MDASETRARIADAVRASADTVRWLETAVDRIADLAGALVGALQAGGKVLACGNGGSAAEAMHMAEELVGRYKGNRRSLPGIALTADGTALTCIGNDFGFDHVFSRQVEGLGRAGDVLVVFSTSGKAANLERAVRAAEQAGMLTVAILGRDGGALAGRCDRELCVPGQATERIQEAHQVLIHLLLEEVERAFAD